MDHHKATRMRKRDRYVRNACNECKRRKVKCTGEACCQRCLDHGVQCKYDRVITPEQDVSTKVSSRYKDLEERLLELQSSVSQALKCIKESSQDEPTEAHDIELDALLLQAAQRADACRFALPCRETSQSPARDWQVFDCSSDLFSPSLSATVGKVEMAKNFKPGILSFPFTNTEVRDLIDHFRFEAECFYPFIPFDSLTSLAAAIDGQGAIPNRSTSPASQEWDDKFDSRNLDLLRLVLACAIVSKSNRETEISRHMMSAASGHLAIKLNGLGLEFDTKDIVISALLSVYFLLCDETTLAWRKIGTAAKMCQELGLHKSIGDQAPWVVRMFWSIYVLDKRLSFMVQLPFTLHDEDIGHTIPANDTELHYISSLIKYLRIAARFVPRMPKLGTKYLTMEPTTCTSLDIEADQWALSTSINSALAPSHERHSHSKRTDETLFKNTLVTVCRNQLKISLYKHNLFSLESIAQNPEQSHKAVSTAAETIRSCKNLQARTAMYQLQAVHFNFFVLSAVAALYLAVRHAPLEFSNTPKDIFAGFQILKPYCISSRLSKRVETLENAMKRLGYDPMGIGAQLNFKELPRAESTSYEIESISSEEIEVMRTGGEPMAFVPRLGTFSSFLLDSEGEMPRNEIDWMDSPAHPQQQWNLWENHAWLLSSLSE